MSKKIQSKLLCLFLIQCIHLTSLCTAEDATVSSNLPTQPEQVHLSLGADESEMIVTWTTQGPTGWPYVKYMTDGQPSPAEVITYGSTDNFTDGGISRKTRWMHRVVLQQLTPRTSYSYRVGHVDGLEYSSKDPFTFTTFPPGSDWSPRLLVYGDLGFVNAQSVPRITQEVKNGQVDAILHIGDFAYDMHDSNGDVGDSFMNMIEPFAASVPYQTAVGNHEEAYNFSNYDARFTMMDQNSRTKSNHFYSFNVGPVHFVVFSTEFYFVQGALNQIRDQYDWLKADLELANKPENRAERPWIITLAHRPMYSDEIRFKPDSQLIREGLPIINKYGLEDLLHSHAVDVQFYGHEHKYQRLWPVYRKTVLNGSTDEPYTDPGASVHIVTGSAGCKERLSPKILSTRSAWKAYTVYDYGYTRLKIINSSHIHLQQVSDDEDGHIVDEFTIIKSHHGPFPSWSPLDPVGSD